MEQALAHSLAEEEESNIAAESDLGKRKNPFEEEAAGTVHQKKIFFPALHNPDLNLKSLLIGPRGSTQKLLQEQSGAKISFGGKGSKRDKLSGAEGSTEDEEDLHVILEGSEEAIARASLEVEQIFFNPERAAKLKEEQMEQLRAISAAGNSNNNSSHSHSHHGPTSVITMTAGSGGRVISGISVATNTYCYGPVVNQLTGEHHLEVKVPHNLTGFVIGSGGETLLKIQSQTGIAHIHVSKESEMRLGESHRSVHIRGSQQSVSAALRKVQEIIGARMEAMASRSAALGAGTGLHTTKTVVGAVGAITSTAANVAPSSSSGIIGGAVPIPRKRELDSPVVFKVPIPNDRIGSVIGKGGATINGVKERTGAKVLIPNGPDEMDPSVRTVSIGGDYKEQVEAAYMEIYTLLMREQQQQQLHPPLVVQIPNDKIGGVIGKAGATVKDIQARLRVRIMIPPHADAGSNPPVRTCTITGSHEDQQAALYVIAMILQGQPYMMPASSPFPTMGNIFLGGM